MATSLISRQLTLSLQKNLRLSAAGKTLTPFQSGTPPDSGEHGGGTLKTEPGGVAEVWNLFLRVCV